MNNRWQIEKVKREFQAALNQSSERFRRAIIREIDYLYRKHGSGNLTAFLDEFQRYFDIPAPSRQAIIKDLSSAQEMIAELWQDYYEDAGVLFPDFGPNDFEKMSALYKVDFSKIASDAGKVITNEIRRSIRSGAGYDALRSRLQKRSLGDAETRTLAQTALAQFDNAMMFEFAQQGGVEQFKYDGVLHPNTRPFCREHIGKKFTLDEIRQMDNGQGIPVETSCGGYNCTHWWTPVLDELPKRNVAVKRRKKVEGSQALGIPVSRALNVRVRGELKRSVDSGIRMIDRVHGDGNLGELPVFSFNSRNDSGGFIIRADNFEPIKIVVNPDGPTKELTTVHEIGHFLDHSGIGAPREMSSASDELMNEWRNAARNSSSYAQMVEILQRGYIERPMPDGTVRRLWDIKLRDHFEYLLSDEELWARSYAQYVAVKSKDETLLSQVEYTRSRPIDGMRQWSDDDFKPIEQAIDKLFKKIGWMS